MIDNIFLADADNPLRLPDWRMSLVNEYRLHSRNEVPDDEDRLVVNYLDFTDQYKNMSGDRLALRKLRRMNPGMFDCFQLEHNDTSDLTTILEAYLLSGETYEDIASNLSILPQTVDYYESINFDVKGRLDRRMWLANYIINSARYKRQDATIRVQQNIIYKLCALYGGPLMLEVMYTGFNNRMKPNHVDSIGTFMDDTIKDFIRARGAMAVRTLSSSDEDNMKEIMKLAHKIGSVIQEEKKSVFEENVSDVLEMMPWDIANKQARLAHPANIHPSIELRASELFLPCPDSDINNALKNLEDCAIIRQQEEFDQNQTKMSN